MIFGLFLFAMLCGSIPFGLIIARSQGIDIRTVGSGNIGATNVLRVLGTKLGLVAFALDVVKGFVPTLIARSALSEPLVGLDTQAQWFIVGLGAMLGHMFSPFLGFKGGKGIATGFGLVLGAATVPGLSAFGVFILVAAITRYVSLASIVCIWCIVFFGIFFPEQSRQIVPLYLVMAVFVTFKHRSNIQRLRQGTESKISFRKAPVVAAETSDSK